MFNKLIQYQELGPEDRAMIDRFAAIGIEPGTEYDRSRFDADRWKAIEDGVTEGRKAILQKASRMGSSFNGWDFSPANAGKWGNDYLTRAAAAWKVIYLNSPDEAIYPLASVDVQGVGLDGAKGSYTLTFTRDQIPRVRYFWSLTMYTERGNLYPNPVNRYLVNSSQKLHYGSDGSLILYLQHTNPGGLKTGNWLPAPRGPFYVILRMYGPEMVPNSGAGGLPPLVRH
jgi:hypothetical protein